MIEVTFVSTNPGKVREVREVLAHYGVRVRWVRRPLPELQSDSLEEVALHKLRASGARRGYTLVEDSGLFVRSLADFPGVYSAHFLKIWGFRPIFELLRGRNRSASFRTVAVLGHGRERRVFHGEVRGTIATDARGSNGFGYDPIFVPRGYSRTFGELPSDVKNALSHRARALHEVGAYLARRESAASAPRKKRKKGLV